MQNQHQILEDIMNEARVHYEYVDFTFRWTWIRDKQIVVQGDKYKGMLLILDKDDNVIKMYGYELVSEE
jgi:hypothetical protein